MQWESDLVVLDRAADVGTILATEPHVFDDDTHIPWQLRMEWPVHWQLKLAENEWLKEPRFHVHRRDNDLIPQWQEHLLPNVMV